MAAAAVVLGGATPAAAEQTREPLVVIGLRPARGSFNGATDQSRVRESVQLRTAAEDAVRQVTNRSTLDESVVRRILGKKYGVAFLRCRGQVPCVSRMAAKVAKRASRAIYGDYVVVRRTYRLRLRLVDLRRAKVLEQVEIKLSAKQLDDVEAWARGLAPLLPSEIEAVPPGEPTPETSAVATSDAPPDPATPDPAPRADPAAASPDAAAPPAPPAATDELPAISTDGGTASSPAATAAATANAEETGEMGDPDDAFIDTSVLEAIDRGIVLHGHFDNITAVGVKGAFRGDWLMFEDRLQLELESDLKQVRVIGKPQLVYDVLDDELRVQFRELYARREYATFEIAVGEQILTWGGTDFWPVVDILSPRDFTQLRNWRPIDEKLPVPMLQTTWQLGAVSLQLVGVPVLRRSRFVVEQGRPFAIPVPAPTGTTVEQASSEPTLWTAGGGARLQLAVRGWKLGLYGLVGRDPLPSVHAQIDLPNPTRFIVDNDRVAMAAASVQGAFLGVILRAEAAGYHRLDDACEGQDDIVFGVPECFYLRRVPTARATFALERKILPGLDAHLQLISEYTRAKDIPPLPAATDVIAPGLPEQYPWNKIVTLRLQGDYRKSDFRPMLFAYASVEDEAMFVNADLEYHVADGFALAVGGFWFHGFADDPNKNKYTLAGSLASSSNLYVRATAWF